VDGIPSCSTILLLALVVACDRGAQSKVAVDEYWISQDVGLIGSTLKSSPKAKTTAKIKSLTRKEPDPSLFVIPPDYRIEV